MNKNSIAPVTERTPLDLLFDCLASSERRYLLGYLHERVPASESQDELATTLAAKKHDTSPDRLTAEERQEVLHTLHHAHLPKLERAGLIVRDTDKNAVEPSDHPAYQDARIREVITDAVAEGNASLDELFRALSESRRRTILDILSHHYQPVEVRSVARDVAASEQQLSPRELSAEAVDQIILSLQYVHLPHLAQAGLVEYDADEETITYEGHPVLSVPWMYSELIPDSKETLPNRSIDAET